MSNMNPPIHLHLCEDCGCRYQCLAVGCDADDALLCNHHYDKAVGFPRFDPEADHQTEELRGIYHDNIGA